MSKEEKNTCEECEHSQTTEIQPESEEERMDLKLAELFYALMNKDHETTNKIAQDLELPKETINEMLQEVEKNPDVYTTIAILETLGFSIVAQRNNIQIPLEFS